jgi:hypothetical protein
LATDPERYFIALLSAHIVLGKLKGLSETCVLESFAGARLGTPVQEIDFRNGLGEKIGWSDVLALARPANRKALATFRRKIGELERWLA